MIHMRKLGIALLGAAIGCGSSTSNPADAGNATDTGTPAMDVPATDNGSPTTDNGTATDRTDAGTVADRPDAGPLCGRLPAMPIARPATGDTVHVMGDTTSAYNTQTGDGGLARTAPVAPPSGSTTCVADRGQVAYSYTVGTAAAALRISTTNPGTPHNFDTVLYVTSRCANTLTAAACNDDDPAFASSADRRVSSSVTTEVLAAGTTVYVIIGGFYPPSTDGATIDHGPFELTVQELPPVAMGGTCNTDGSTMRCGTGLDCVGATPSAATGTCRPTGSAAGSRCRTSAPECDSSLACNATSGFCQNTVPAGMACDAFNACATGSSCITLVDGSIRGTCAAAGSSLGAACRPVGSTGGRCDGTLVCNGDLDTTITNPVCVQQAAAGGACAAGRVVCSATQSCIYVRGGLIGTCHDFGTVAGAACRTTGMPCDGTLQCLAPTDGAATRCINVAAVGGACDDVTDCPSGARCYLTDLSNRFVGRCGADGAAGGICNATAPACTGSLVCSNPTNPTSGLCQSQGTDGTACTRPVSGCASGVSCVNNAGSLTMGTCHTDGAVAGAACRSGDMPCATGLTCSGTVLSAGVCQTTAAAGGACDPIAATIRCPTGQVCAATSYTTGLCAAPTGMETEPNDSPAAVMAHPVTATTTLNSALPRGDVDCVAVTVPANGSVVALVGDGNGRCPAPFPGGISLDLYGTDGTTIRGISQQSAFGSCAMIDGTRADVFPYAHGLAAGTYYVCARGYVNNTTGVGTGPVDAYVLSVAIAN